MEQRPRMRPRRRKNCRQRNWSASVNSPASSFFRFGGTSGYRFGAAIFLSLLCVTLPRWARGDGGNATDDQCVDNSSSANRYERLLEAFLAEGKVTIAPHGIDGDGDGDGEMGVFAAAAVRKGDVVLKVDRSEDLSPELADATYPNFRKLVEVCFAPYEGDERPRIEHVMTSILLLLVAVNKGVADSSLSHPVPTAKWERYVDSLPPNVTGTAYTWSHNELHCSVPRKAAITRSSMAASKKPRRKAGVTAFSLRRTMQNFREGFEKLTQFFPPLRDLIMDRGALAERADWAYLIVQTRSFGNSGTLKPIFDMANHDPTRGTAPFEFGDATYFVAPFDLAAGDQIFNSYGHHLYPAAMVEGYGFVDQNAAFVNSPSITLDLVSDPRTQDLDHCTQGEALFFGNVTETKVTRSESLFFQKKIENKEERQEFEEKVDADGKFTTTFRPFRPTHTLYECVKEMLQTDDGPKIARYVIEKVERDAKAYENMASDPTCQGGATEEGKTLELLREANALTGRLLRGVLEVARKAAAGKDEYPGISYP